MVCGQLNNVRIAVESLTGMLMHACISLLTIEISRESFLMNKEMEVDCLALVLEKLMPHDGPISHSCIF